MFETNTFAFNVPRWHPRNRATLQGIIGTKLPSYDSSFGTLESFWRRSIFCSINSNTSSNNQEKKQDEKGINITIGSLYKRK
jgi:hypothetical protein